MAIEKKIKIPKHTDQSIIKSFREVADRANAYDITLNTIGMQAASRIKINEESERLDRILEKKSSLIDTLTLHISNHFSISFYRGGKGEQTLDSALYDEIVINSANPQQVDESLSIDLISILSRDLKATNLGRSPSKTGREQAALESIHNSTLERLESLNEELVVKTHDYRSKLEEEALSKSREKDQEVEAFKKRLEQEYLKKESELQAEREELEQRRAELDDKDNTHARREIRKNILDEIKKRQESFSLTAGTNKMRAPILVAMSCLIGFFVLLTLFNLNDFFRVLDGSDYSKILIVAAKQSLYVAGAVGSLIFLIRWMNRWFELHTKAEFDLKQFELDMERASWLVETSLEWKDAKGNAIPRELLESLSRNLFVRDGEQVEKLQDPADQLASAILGSSSSIKLKAGDSVLDVNPSKLIKAQKKAEADSDKE